jgi:hypothetical protein
MAKQEKMLSLGCYLAASVPVRLFATFAIGPGFGEKQQIEFAPAIGGAHLNRLFP